MQVCSASDPFGKEKTVQTIINAKGKDKINTLAHMLLYQPFGKEKDSEVNKYQKTARTGNTHKLGS